MGRIYPWAICEKILLHVLLVLGDHLLNHLTANRTGLLGSQVAVVTLLEVHAYFVGTFHLKTVHRLFVNRLAGIVIAVAVTHEIHLPLLWFRHYFKTKQRKNTKEFLEFSLILSRFPHIIKDIRRENA